jgi:ketosteroid isomerase-like protein
MSITTRTYAKIVPFRRALIIGLIAFLGIAVVAGYIWIMTDQVIARPMDSLSLVTTFHNAINSDDVDAMLALFADDATVNDNGSVIEGKELIRDWALHSQRMTGLRLTLFHSEQNEENIIWLDKAHNGSEVQNRYYILRWEAIIRDGKIQSLAAMPRYWPDLK